MVHCKPLSGRPLFFLRIIIPLRSPQMNRVNCTADDGVGVRPPRLTLMLAIYRILNISLGFSTTQRILCGAQLY